MSERGDDIRYTQYLIDVAHYVLKLDFRDLEYAFVGFEGYESRVEHVGKWIFVVTDPEIVSLAKLRVKDHPQLPDRCPISYTQERPMLLIRPSR